MQKNLNSAGSFSSILLSYSLIFSMFAHGANEEYKEPDTLIEIQVSTPRARSYIASMGYAIEQILSDKVIVFGTKSDALRLQSSGFQIESVPLKKSWKDADLLGKKYTSYQDTLKVMNNLANQNPELVQILSLGKSHEGRDTPVLRISSKSLGQAESENTPAAFFMGCHHSREHMSVEVPLEFAKFLVKQYTSNTTVKRLIDTREIYIAPIVNPDGYVYDYTDGIRGRMWRKNRRPNGDGSFGVDLNRNYGFKWGTSGVSRNPGADTYLGAAPFSEIESQNVKAFLDTHDRVNTLVTFHSFAAQILYPWSYGDVTISQTHPEQAQDLDIFKKMAKDMAAYSGYLAQQSSEMYPSSGDTGDWAYAAHRIFAFTIELGPEEYADGGFYPDPDKFTQKIFQENLKSMLYLTEYADNPGRVLDDKEPAFELSPAQSGVPLASPKDLKF